MKGMITQRQLPTPEDAAPCRCGKNLKLFGSKVGTANAMFRLECPPCDNRGPWFTSIELAVIHSGRRPEARKSLTLRK